METSVKRQWLDALLAFIIFVVAPAVAIIESRTIVAIVVASTLIIWLLQQTLYRTSIAGLFSNSRSVYLPLGVVALFFLLNLAISIDRTATSTELVKRLPIVLGCCLLYLAAKTYSFKPLAVFAVLGSLISLFLLTIYLEGWVAYTRPSEFPAIGHSVFNRAVVISTVVSCIALSLLNLSKSSVLKLVGTTLVIAILLQTLMVSDSQTALVYFVLFCSSLFWFMLFPSTVSWVKYGVVLVVLVSPLVVFVPDSKFLIELDNPLINPLLQSASVEVRLQIWRGFASLIAERPIWGWGFGTENLISELKETALPNSILSHHPHSLPIQLWFNAGLIGVTLFLVAIWTFLKRVEKASGDYAIFAMAFSVATFLCWCFSHGAWQSWWLVLIMLPYFALFGFKCSHANPPM